MGIFPQNLALFRWKVSGKMHIMYDDRLQWRYEDKLI